jgi:hypothetical protein
MWRTSWYRARCRSVRVFDGSVVAAGGLARTPVRIDSLPTDR